ncbi:hypothetical protein P5673_026485 [Acropora cervicornis]|uniref:Uncharacterized protein n=1 Tax=Acropora cervicornis TaxID=6130 RepID=A0AAD9Q0E9_ACRCE|nr:hypothetical protein P5673_026485 [Acropora cervicornis]
MWTMHFHAAESEPEFHPSASSNLPKGALPIHQQILPGCTSIVVKKQFGGTFGGDRDMVYNWDWPLDRTKGRLLDRTHSDRMLWSKRANPLKVRIISF